MASTTRQLLSVALKDQLRSTPLDKVTVSSLTAQAGITRQTFYYHFADVYDLAVWVFEQEVANHIMEHASYSEWAKGALHNMGCSLCLNPPVWRRLRVM